MDKNYYTEYFQLERSHWWFLARQEILRTQVVKLFGSSQSLRILNIGAATGASSQMLQAFGHVVSVEYEQDCIEFVKDKLDFPLIYGSILELSFPDQSFDLVCAFDVIEHVNDHLLAANEMRRVCKPNGYVMATVPAFMELWSKHDEVNHHFRRYRQREFLGLFKQEKIVYSSYFNFYLFLPIYALRNFSKLFPKQIKRSGSGSDFGLVKSILLNSFFYRMFLSENLFLNQYIKLPFGVSLLGIWQKQSA
ncbi:MAG: class I SAM-dependent methyltransferase [bacterium]|nr:class I SAM-dependent methyltransferase [bacterium]